MILLRAISSVLRWPFRREGRVALDPPTRIEWNSTLPALQIRVGAHRIFYTVKGGGEPVILIHGYGAGIWVWEKQIEILSRSYRVYLLDLIGHGFSDRPKISYTPETYVRLLKGFMDKLGMKKAVLIGNSMGGGIAWAMTLLFPERVRRIVLIDCTPPDVLRNVRNDSFQTLALIRRIPVLPHVVIACRDRTAIRQVLEECVFDRRLITREVLNREYELLRVEGTTWVLCSTFKNAKGALKFNGELSKISSPTLFIWGEKDLIFPPAVGQALHRTIRGSRLKVIPRSGHIPMWETPEEVNEAILSFLSEN